MQTPSNHDNSGDRRHGKRPPVDPKHIRLLYYEACLRSDGVPLPLPSNGSEHDNRRYEDEVANLWVNQTKPIVEGVVATTGNWRTDEQVFIDTVEKTMHKLSVGDTFDPSTGKWTPYVIGAATKKATTAINERIRDGKRYSRSPEEDLGAIESCDPSLISAVAEAECLSQLKAAFKALSDSYAASDMDSPNYRALQSVMVYFAAIEANGVPKGIRDGDAISKRALRAAALAVGMDENKHSARLRSLYHTINARYLRGVCPSGPDPEPQRPPDPEPQKPVVPPRPPLKPISKEGQQ